MFFLNHERAMGLRHRQDKLPALFCFRPFPFPARSVLLTGLVLLCLPLCSCSDKRDELWLSDSFLSPVPEASKQGKAVTAETTPAYETAGIPAQSSAGETAGIPEGSSAGGTAGIPEQSSAGGTADIPAQSSAGGTAGIPAQSPIPVYVDVAGAVRYPGVYTLPDGSRVFEAIDAAGGFEANAASSALNQALPVYDGEQVYVPTLEEAEHKTAASAAQETVFPEYAAYAYPASPSRPEGIPMAEDSNKAAAGIGSTGKVNINCANEAELATLHGIGQTRARAIIEYRTANGPFTEIEDIMKISGIKQGIFSKIKDQITTS